MAVSGSERSDIIFLTVGTKNQQTCDIWLEGTLKKTPPGFRILNAGTGKSRCKKFCTHLKYVSQDLVQYNGEWGWKCASRYFYEKHLPDHNFTIVEQVENGNYFEYLAQELR